MSIVRAVRTTEVLNDRYTGKGGAYDCYPNRGASCGSCPAYGQVGAFIPPTCPMGAAPPQGDGGTPNGGKSSPRRCVCGVQGRRFSTQRAGLVSRRAFREIRRPRHDDFDEMQKVSGQTGHAQAVQVMFDPRQISYGKLLQIYFSVAHDPTQLRSPGTGCRQALPLSHFLPGCHSKGRRRGLYRPACQGARVQQTHCDAAQSVYGILPGRGRSPGDLRRRRISN